jgi:hypothetical protein
MMRSCNQGFIALTVVLLVSAVAVIFGLSRALMNINQLSSSNAWLETSLADVEARSCLDNALSRLRNDSTLTGNVNISVSNVDCIATISGSGDFRTVVMNATSTDARSQEYTIRTSVTVNINTNPFTVDEYKDIID